MSAWASPDGFYFIAEIGLNHNGNLDSAKRLIDIAIDAGCHAVKFQKRHVSSLAVQEVLNAPDTRFPSLGTTYRELREAHEFSFREFEILRDRASAGGIDFFTTPFDEESLAFLEDFGAEKYKVASHSVTNLPLLERIADLQKPVLMSTGMSTQSELDDAVEIVSAGVSDLALLHCVSAYPTESQEARLDLIPFFRRRYGLEVGYSGHEIGILPTLMAVGQGATIIERHITLDSNLEGFDHRLSLEPESLRGLVGSIREVRSMFGDGPRIVTDRERTTRAKYQVSMVLRHELLEGEILEEHNIAFRNPGTGIKPGDSGDLLGKRAVKRIEPDVILKREWFE